MALISSFGDREQGINELTDLFKYSNFDVNEKSNWNTYKYADGVIGHIGLLFVNQSNQYVLTCLITCLLL